MYGTGQENLRDLATSLSQTSEEEILGGIQLSQEINLVKLQGSVKKEAVLGYLPMAKARDKGLLFKVILAAVVWFIEGFKEGSRMRSSDILKFGYYLFEYQLDSVEDIILCFKMAEAEELRDPDSGQKIKRYATMDIELLKKYWHAYLDYKAALREEAYRSEKHRLNGGDYRTEEDTRIKQIERNTEFLKDFKAATGQVQRWVANDNLTPLQTVVANRFKEMVK